MMHRPYFPAFPLDQFISVFIYFEGIQHAHKVDRFLPNGDTEILIDFKEGPQFIYDNTSLKEIQACHHVWTSGIRTEPITIPSGTDAAMMVIAFRKGMAAPFFPFPMNEIADCVLDADLVWGHDFASLREQLLETCDIDLRFHIVEAFLLQKFRSSLDLNPCVAFALEQMTYRPNEINIALMNSQIGYSQRHFTDMFRRHVGITPKAYLRIMRFQKAVRTIDETREIDWPRVSLECGFYDQSHFINDFKHFSGFTPDEYSKIHTSYQNYIPVG